LQAFNEPFNEDKNCWSHANEGVYHIGIDSEGRNKLTNLKCEKNDLGSEISEFSISELEVWAIVFEK
jgi:hypothetical protein